MGPPEPMLAAIHDSAANHHHVACGPAPNLLCKPAAAQPVSAYQAFAREQRPLLSGSLARREAEKVLRQRWKALSKPEKGRYQTNGVERRNVARSPYNMFCQAQRPFLSPELRNSQREAALGQLWAALPGTERAKYAPAPAAPVQAQAPPAASWYHRSAPPRVEDRSRGKRAKIAALCFPSAALPAAPPAPLAPTAPPGAPLAPPPAPAPPMAVPVPVPVPVPVLYYPIAVEGWEAAATATVAAGWATPFALSAPSTTSTSPELLTAVRAVATHRTFEHFLGEDQQLARVAENLAENLAEMMEQQMTEEDAMEIAFLLGMPE